MAMEKISVPMIDLTKDDISSMPEPVRKKFTNAIGYEGDELDHNCNIAKERVLLVKTIQDDEQTLSRTYTSADVAKTFEFVYNILMNRNIADENDITKLTNSILNNEARIKFEEKIKSNTAQLRARYLEQVETYTVDEIHALSSNAGSINPLELASKLKREKQIFAIKYDGEDLYPAFQFANGIPLPVIKRILQALPASMDFWKIAFWFWSGNGWLGGKKPEECLGNESGVVYAAEQKAEPVIG